MSYEDGLAALNLEMPDRVPRTEYSAETHWELIKKITGRKVNSFSGKRERQEASNAFIKTWDYGMYWNILINKEQLDKCRTKMGHANYAADGVDYDNEVSCPFEDPEDVFDFDPMAVYGEKTHSELVKAFNEDYAFQRKNYPEAVGMTGTYISMVSGLLEIFGWDFFWRWEIISRPIHRWTIAYIIMKHMRNSEKDNGVMQRKLF